MRKLPGELVRGDKLVGDEGNECFVYEVERSNIVPGTVNVLTEFGYLLLDDDKSWPVIGGSNYYD